MPKSRSTAKLVITSVVISLAVIAVFALVFLNYLVPAYQISEDQIYSVLIRLFPILIGLILVQVGVMIAKRHEDEFRDQVDKLPPNAYTKTFESAPKDDPYNISIDATRTQEEVAARTASASEPAAVREIIKEVPVEKVVVKEVPVEVIREIEKEVPVIKEVIKEVQVPSETQVIEKEVPVEVIREVPVEVIKEVIKEVPSGSQQEVVKEVPVIKEVVREVPIEIVKEVPVEVPVTVEVEKIVEKPVEVEKVIEKPVASAAVSAQESRMLGFEDVLSEECSSARADGYDITLALVRKADTDETSLEKAFGSSAFIFERENDYALIFSFANEAETKSIISSKEAELGKPVYSVATLSGAEAQPDSLIKLAAAGL